MKTVAIVSFTDSENYGANLQALALQEVIKDLGLHAEYINYTRPILLKGNRFIMNKIWKVVRRFFGYQKRLQNTNLFNLKYLSKTSKIDSLNDLLYLDNYDFYVAGSDQIWQPRLIDVTNSFYFLNFAPHNAKKISYASSIGINEIPEQLKNKYKNNLKDFAGISVRESQAVTLLSNLGINSIRVLDPTLLLIKSKWLKFYNDQERVIKVPYILCYVMTGDNKGVKYINKLSQYIKKKTNVNYKIVVLGDKEYKKILPNYHLITNAGPDEFLNLIDGASYVITNSYHGTCFSVNFEKEFYSILHKDNPLNNRITDFLDMVNLSNRIVYSDSDFTNIELIKIKYDYASNELNKRRVDSIAFLSKELD